MWPAQNTVMPLRILIVEDYAPFRRMTRDALQRRAEFEIFEATDGLEALQKIEHLQPGLILLDINLPKLHGFEVASRVGRIAPHARLLFMSQESSSDIVRKALSLGARGYIQKASAATDLLPAIDAVLAGEQFVSRSVAFSEPADASARHVSTSISAENTVVFPGRRPDVAGAAEDIRAQYAAIVESSDDAIVAKNLDGVISAWNAAAERMFGYTAHEAIGRPITMIIPPELYDEEQDILRRLRRGERLEHYQTLRVTKAGARIDVSLTIWPVRDLAGRIIGCSKIARDITETKKAEAALRQSEQQLAREVAGAKTLQSISARLIVESTQESLYAQILDAATELMASDAASLQMLATDHTALRLLAWKNFHPDSAAFWQRVTIGAGSTCSQALARNERVLVADIETCEFMAGTPDQQEYRRSGIRAVQSTPLQSRSGEPLGMLSTHWRTPHTPTEEDFTLFDVLVREAADMIERTLGEEAVRDSEERFRLIANTAPVMIWMTDVRGLVTYLNETYLDFTGLPLETALGDGWTAIPHPDDVDRYRHMYAAAVEQQAPFAMEQRLRRHDGEYRWVVSRGVPRYNTNRSFAGYIGTAVDITERKLAEEALSTVSQKLIEAHEEERTRIARELHDDITQRLAVLSVHIGYLKQSRSASETEFDQDISAVSDQITDLVSDVQALSHRLHSSRLDLLGLEAATTAFCEEFSNRYGVKIDVHVENVPNPLPPEIALCLYRVLQEGLQNVFKHSGSPRVNVSLTGHANDIRLSVKDWGTGFDPDEAMRGPGLGLTSMSERLKIVGGQFSLQSTRHEGTVIHASVPLRP